MVSCIPLLLISIYLFTFHAFLHASVTDRATSISRDDAEGREGLIGLQEKKERDLHKYMQVRSCDLATPSYTPKGVYNRVYGNIQDDRVNSLATLKGVEDGVGK